MVAPGCHSPLLVRVRLATVASVPVGSARESLCAPPMVSGKTQVFLPYRIPGRSANLSVHGFFIGP
jgi:hypothetical protein